MGNSGEKKHFSFWILEKTYLWLGGLSLTQRMSLFRLRYGHETTSIASCPFQTIVIEGRKWGNKMGKRNRIDITFKPLIDAIIYGSPVRLINSLSTYASSAPTNANPQCFSFLLWFPSSSSWFLMHSLAMQCRSPSESTRNRAICFWREERVDTMKK